MNTFSNMLMAPSPWLVMGLLFLAFSATVGALGWWWLQRQRVQQRWQVVAQAKPLSADEGISVEQASVADQTLDKQDQPAWLQLAQPIARWAIPDDGDEIKSHQVQFLQAGLGHRAAPWIFYITKVALVLLLPALTWLILSSAALSVRSNTLLLSMLLAAGLGYYGPPWWLHARIKKRAQKLFEAFPDAIDLIIVCMEAGLGLDMAIDRAGRDIGLRSPDLAQELALVVAEQRLGLSRARALQQLALRTGVEEIRLFVAMLLQADRFGISVADSMRIHAEELRNRRAQRAEEAAAKIPLKMLFPMIFAMFPAMLLVLMGPAAIQLIRYFQ
jgi:tight adherence protein C